MSPRPTDIRQRHLQDPPIGGGTRTSHPPSQILESDVLLRATQIVGPNGLLPISRAKFYALVASGELPRPIKLGRISLWSRAQLLLIVKGA
jgi:predicted DNA-binding transcriptional regulator AlpA